MFNNIHISTILYIESINKVAKYNDFQWLAWRGCGDSKDNYGNINLVIYIFNYDIYSFCKYKQY